MRKVQDQNSAESGYSDEHPSDIDGDDETAGPSTRIPKVPNFDANLLMFDRTASPTCSERRRSESPLINDFSVLSLFSRAQSEPPRIRADSSGDPEPTDSDTFEVLDLIPDSIDEPCVASPLEEPDRESRLIVTPPPEVHVHKHAKLKAHSRKQKKDKKRKANAGKTESAEQMFIRLTRRSSCSSSTTSYDDDDYDIEEIQEIPMDDVDVTSVQEEECLAVSLEASQPLTVDSEEPQPSTSTKADDISILSTKEQEYLQRREARLQRLEAEAKEFYDKMARNKDKGLQLNNHINDIHHNFMVRYKERTKSEDEKSSEVKSAAEEPSTSAEAAEKTDESTEPDDAKQDDEK